VLSVAMLLALVVMYIQRRQRLAYELAVAQEQSTTPSELEALAARLRLSAAKIRAIGREEEAVQLECIANHLSKAAGHKREASILNGQAALLMGNIQARQREALESRSLLAEEEALQELQKAANVGGELLPILHEAAKLKDDNKAEAAKVLDDLTAQLQALDEEEEQLQGLSEGAERDNALQALAQRRVNAEAVEKELESQHRVLAAEKRATVARREVVEAMPEGEVKEAAIQALQEAEAAVEAQQRELGSRQERASAESRAIQMERQRIEGLSDGAEREATLTALAQRRARLQQRYNDAEQALQNGSAMAGAGAAALFGGAAAEVEEVVKMANAKVHDQAALLARRRRQLGQGKTCNPAFAIWNRGRTKVDPLHQKYAANPVWLGGDNPAWQSELSSAWDVPISPMGRGAGRSGMVLSMSELGVESGSRPDIDAVALHNARRLLETTHEQQDAADHWADRSEFTVAKLNPKVPEHRMKFELPHLRKKTPRSRLDLRVDTLSQVEKFTEEPPEDIASPLHHLDTQGMAENVLGDRVQTPTPLTLANMEMPEIVLEQNSLPNSPAYETPKSAASSFKWSPEVSTPERGRGDLYSPERNTFSTPEESPVKDAPSEMRRTQLPPLPFAMKAVRAMREHTTD